MSDQTYLFPNQISMITEDDNNRVLLLPDLRERIHKPFDQLISLEDRRSIRSFISGTRSSSISKFSV
ncbi:hypothetical protein C481_03477 [Natrialba asiatica DSM 12278]|uniref:Uncharacterized protein n=1 Tax=Natrialba asiatica (strain ATCC 700177 / DSM 12278 / JCM 9576 / FERM P-10747 / NBRC 102637 / 172P1) TaxID=29540 RepID=M0B410_NATA1|nr:hypothetical protein C481_03477 [Natrialba asiatica DSM 12278]